MESHSNGHLSSPSSARSPCRLPPTDIILHICVSWQAYVFLMGSRLYSLWTGHGNRIGQWLSHWVLIPVWPLTTCIIPPLLCTRSYETMRVVSVRLPCRGSQLCEPRCTCKGLRKHFLAEKRSLGKAKVGCVVVPPCLSDLWSFCELCTNQSEWRLTLMERKCPRVVLTCSPGEGNRASMGAEWTLTGLKHSHNVAPCVGKW